jgi:two-component system chemotaxis sensor kinase CheA
MEAILRPLVESAGYRVVASGSAGSEAASVVIASAEAETAAAPAGARLVRVRAAAEGSDDSVHRYDRDSLLAALAGEAPGKRRRRNG